MPRATTIGDLRDRARRRLPRMLFDDVDGGSFAEATLRASEAAFEAVHPRQRVLRDVSTRSLAATVPGRAQALPLLLGPVGFAGPLWPRGEIPAARAAGVGTCLSAMSIRSLDEVVEVGGAEGVARAIDIIGHEMDRTLALVGLASLHGLLAAGPGALVPAVGARGAATSRPAGPTHHPTAGADASAA